MRELLGASEKRRLSLVELLLRAFGQWFDINRVAELLDTNVPNVKNDVSELRKIDIDIQMNNQAIRINPDHKLSVESLYRIFLRNTTAFNIIEEVAINPTHSAQTLADELFISQSTVYRQIDLINDVLPRVFDVKIDTRPYRIVGEEIKVRNFLSEFFAELYPLGVWPFENIDYHLLQDIIFYFTEELGYNMRFPYCSFVTIVTGISLLRTKQGFLIEGSSNNITMIYEILKTSDRYQELKESFEEAYDLPLDLTTIVQMFTPFVESHFFFSYDALFMASQTEQYLKSSLTFLEYGLDRLARQFQFPIENRNDLILNLHNTLHLNRTEIYVRPILFERKKEFLQEVQTQYTEFFNSAYEFIVEYQKFLKADDDQALTNHLVYTLFTHWDQLFVYLEKYNQLISVLVISRYDPYHAKSLAEQIELHFSSLLKVTVYESEFLYIDKIAESEHEIIITNFDFPVLEGKKHAFISNTLTPIARQELNSVITQIQFEKMDISSNGLDLDKL